MPIYMKIDGIDGDVTASGFERSMAIFAYSFGASLAQGGTGGGGGGTGRASFSDVVISKQVAKGSPTTLLKLCKGTHIPKATLTVTKPAQGNRPEQATLRIELQNVQVVGYQGSGDTGGAVPVESLSLNFTKITYSLAVPGGVEEIAWDLATNTGGGGQ